jgi:hypothetical protein
LSKHGRWKEAKLLDRKKEKMKELLKSHAGHDGHDVSLIQKKVD